MATLMEPHLDNTLTFDVSRSHIHIKASVTEMYINVYSIIRCNLLIKVFS